MPLPTFDPVTDAGRPIDIGSFLEPLQMWSRILPKLLAATPDGLEATVRDLVSGGKGDWLSAALEALPDVAARARGLAEMCDLARARLVLVADHVAEITPPPGEYHGLGQREPA